MATGRTDSALLIPVADAAARLGLARSYVYSTLLTTGKLPSVRIGKRRLIPVAALEQFVREIAKEQGVELPSPAA